MNNDEVQRIQHRDPRLPGLATMDEEALATAAMVSAVSAAVEQAPTTTTDGAPTPPSETPASATAAPQPQEEQNSSSSAFREANTADIEPRNLANEIDGSWVAAIETPQAASRSTASPGGGELNSSYDAYRHAYGSLIAAEVSVRGAENQEDAAINELRRADEVVDAAEEEVAWAAKALRVFDADRGNAAAAAADGTCDGSARERAPLPALSDEGLQDSSTHNKRGDNIRRARERLRVALETAATNADRASAAHVARRKRPSQR